MDFDGVHRGASTFGEYSVKPVILIDVGHSKIACDAGVLDPVGHLEITERASVASDAVTD